MRAHVAPAAVEVVAPRSRSSALYFVNPARDVERDASALDLGRIRRNRGLAALTWSQARSQGQRRLKLLGRSIEQGLS